MSDVRRLSRGLSHDFLTRLEGAGLTPEIAQKVVEDREGRFVRAIVAAAKNGTAFIVKPDLPVWMTVERGDWQNHEAVRQTLEAGGFWVTEWAADILAKTPLDAEPRKVELVRPTVAEMRFVDCQPTTTEIFERAAAFGWGRCPAWVGPALRLAYPNQPQGEWIRVGIDPITGSDGGLYVWSVGYVNDSQWLNARYARPSDRWAPEDLWVFARS